MLRKIAITLISLSVCSAALAAHIVTETRQGDTKTTRTDTYANSAGDLRIDERGYGYSSAASDAASMASTNDTAPTYHLGKVKETTIFQSKDEAIVSLEGNVCRRLTADSAPPPGLGVPGMNIPEMNKQMADAMKQASSKLEEAMKAARKEGMSAEQEDAFKQFVNPLMNSEPVKPRGALESKALGETARVGSYSAEGHLVTTSEGVEKYRVWVVPVRKVKGGKEVRNAMERMAQTYVKYTEKFGGGSMIDTSLNSIFLSKDFANTYPVRIEDLESGETTDVVDANAGGTDAEFYPQCEERDMFGM